MGVSNPEMFLSEKDLSTSNNSMEFSFLVRPPLEFQEEDDECQIAPNFQDVVNDEPRQQQEDKCKLAVVSDPMELKLPCLGESKVHDENGKEEDDDGFKTPTCLDQKIPAMLKCPPAPRKPKALPIISSSAKRKANFRRRILLDFTKEIESLFPPALLADLGNKIKKVRQPSDFK
ncbi:hypothetical protein CCACVL1_20340 [Corchorus capsularis]|uniref:Cyclin-dependent protein kinase inhibitor SMR3-like n=1 Tax=Corchorus capsularis TaxID=210143 RepID=A0A1R3HBN7_COCAP|nr:hypothetical protein CCACVL1_20340 [Corchorus capsularis]